MAGASRKSAARARSTEKRVGAAVLVALALGACAAPGEQPDHHRLGDARSGHTATLLPSGRVLVAGGACEVGITCPPDPNLMVTALSTAELYEPTSETWSFTGALAGRREGHTATLLPSGEVLVIGGWHFSCWGVGPTFGCGYFVPVPESYDPAAGSWSRLLDAPATPRVAHTATLLPSGRILVVGTAFRIAANHPELYDPAAGAWSPAGAPATPSRAGHTATLLASGDVLVVGGDHSDPSVGPQPSVAEIYDPSANGWRLTGSMATPRWGHTATPLPSGRVLVVGGMNFDADPPEVLSSAEVYDPGSGSWSPAGSLATARSRHTATLLPSGKVLVAGGRGAGGSILAGTELYDVASGTWSPGKPLRTDRADHTATRLGSGRVLLVGGWGATRFVNGTDIAELLASVELYQE